MREPMRALRKPLELDPLAPHHAPAMRSGVVVPWWTSFVRQWIRSLMTLNGSPRGIAGGFSLGLSLSLLPVPFVGMLAALATAPLLRCNLPATYLGTAVVNPVTGPLFYFVELYLGMALLGRELPSWARMQALDLMGWWGLFTDAVGPFLLGAVLCCAAGFGLAFPLLYWLSRRWQARRHHHHHHRREHPSSTGDDRTTPP